MCDGLAGSSRKPCGIHGIVPTLHHIGRVQRRPFSQTKAAHQRFVLQSLTLSLGDLRSPETPFAFQLLWELLQIVDSHMYLILIHS